jgi:phosphosulfolactate synthase
MTPPSNPLPYGEIDFLRRAPKPRETGLTMMIDWGLPLDQQHGVLDIAAPHVDLAKVAVGLSAIVAPPILDAKIRDYLAHGVRPFPGGMLLELALAQGRLEHYLSTTRQLGYPVVEVSYNVRPIDPREKAAAIRTATEDHGLTVLAEVGSKHEATPAGELVDDVHRCLAAGAWKVFVEAAELFEGEGFDESLATRLGEELPLDRVIFELPGAWIDGVQAHQVHTMMVWLVDRFGPDVNIGNVASDSVLMLETLRTGAGVTMTLADERSIR